MEGASRPTFFRGVATVVTKLFNIVQPDLAFFGQKDIQQCLILRRMVSDLHFAHPPSPLHLKIVPTVRDHDKLALSSRNAYLSPAERRHAPMLYQALLAAKARVEEELAVRASVSEVDVLAAATQALTEHTSGALADGVKVELDYIKINDPLTLRPMTEIGRGQAAVLSGAVKIGSTRLIDNLLFNVEL
jgi:pantoate--beta-alanine ligase